MKDNAIVEIHIGALTVGTMCVFIIAVCTGWLLFGHEGVVAGFIVAASSILAFITYTVKHDVRITGVEDV